MSVQKVSYNTCPDVVTIENRPDGKISDIWIRQNIESPQPLPEPNENGGDTGWTADEAYMQVDSADCPEAGDVEADIEGWFAYASEWKIDIPSSETARYAKLRADLDYVAAMTGIELEV